MAGEHMQLQIGDDVDMYKEQSNKDTSGWFGPCEGESLSRQSHGMITVRYNNRLHECQVQKIRRHLHFLCLLAASGTSEHFTSVWNVLRVAVERFDFRTTVHLGLMRHGDGYRHLIANRDFPGVVEAVRFFAETIFTYRLLPVPGWQRVSAVCRASRGTRAP